MDEASALSVLRQATDGADDGELFLERRRSEVLSFDDGRLRAANYDAAEGSGRAGVEKQPAAHSTEISEPQCAEQPRPRGWRSGPVAGNGRAPARTNTKLYGD